MDNFKAFIDLVSGFLLGIGVPEFLVQIISTLLTGLILAGLLFYIGHWLISKFLFYNNRRRLSRDLHPFYTKAEIDKATRYYIPTKYQDTAPSQADEPSRSFIDSPKAKLIPMMLKTAFQQDDSRYYLILADSGMGKTTFMMNLFLAYKNQWPWKQKHDIRLLPLGHPQTLAEVEKIEDPKNTILLLDALDEDVEAVKDYKKRLGEILDKTWKFREVVITCRTQFFPSEVEEPSKTGYFRYGTDGGEHFFRKAYVSVFDDKDINRYLRKRFKFWQWKDRKKARRIVQKSPNLMVRPMLLSHIQDLVGEEREYEYTYQIYEVLIQKWVERESNKPGIAEKYGSRENFQKLLLEFSQVLAVDIYENRGKRDGRLSIHKDEKLKTFEGLQLNDFETVEETWAESDWRTRSMLNRDADGFYKFSHKSILEYFIAKKALFNTAFFNKLNFIGFDATKIFFSEMITLVFSPSREIENGKRAALMIPPSVFIRNRQGMVHVRIADLSFISPKMLAHLKIFNLASITVFDINKYRALFRLYALFMDITEKGESINFKYLYQRLLNYLIKNQLSALTERFKNFNGEDFFRTLPYDLESSNSLEIELETLADNDDILKRLVENDSRVLLELQAVNDFIKECQALQAALPNVKIIY
jgi:hypothetical protein